jgi:hypothetical protein
MKYRTSKNLVQKIANIPRRLSTPNPAKQTGFADGMNFSKFPEVCNSRNNNCQNRENRQSATNVHPLTTATTAL